MKALALWAIGILASPAALAAAVEAWIESEREGGRIVLLPHARATDAREVSFEFRLEQIRGSNRSTVRQAGRVRLSDAPQQLTRAQQNTRGGARVEALLTLYELDAEGRRQPLAEAIWHD